MNTRHALSVGVILVLFAGVEATAGKAVESPQVQVTAEIASLRAHKITGEPMKFAVEFSPNTRFTSIILSVTNRGEQPITVLPLLESVMKLNDPRTKWMDPVDEWDLEEDAISAAVRFLDRDGNEINVEVPPWNRGMLWLRTVAAGKTEKIKLHVDGYLARTAKDADCVMLSIRYQAKEVCQVVLRRHLWR